VGAKKKVFIESKYVVRTYDLYLIERGHIHLLTIYAKNEMEDLTPGQKKVLKAITEEIKNG